MYRAVAKDPDNMPILRYQLDQQNSIAKNEDGVIVKLSEYDYMSAWDLNPLDGMLRVVRLLDREKVEHIRLGLIVEDIAAVTGGDKQTASGINYVKNVSNIFNYINVLFDFSYPNDTCRR